MSNKQLSLLDREKRSEGDGAGTVLKSQELSSESLLGTEFSLTTIVATKGKRQHLAETKISAFSFL